VRNKLRGKRGEKKSVVSWGLSVIIRRFGGRNGRIVDSCPFGVAQGELCTGMTVLKQGRQYQNGKTILNRTV
jgi:hypothetical protein